MTPGVTQVVIIRVTLVVTPTIVGKIMRPCTRSIRVKPVLLVG